MPGGAFAAQPAARLAVALTLAASCVCAAAADASGPVAAIEARQAGFKKLGPAMRAITAELRADAPNLAAITAPARVIATQAPALAGWFPAGSDASMGVATKALPSVWNERKEFDEMSAKFALDAQALMAAVESGDVQAVKAQARAVGADCGACHKKYREE